MTRGARTVVVGCGNALRQDDGAGPALVARLRARGPMPGVALCDAGTSGLGAIHSLEGASAAVIVDACRTEAEPGTIHRLEPERVAAIEPARAMKIHAVRWDGALALARALVPDSLPQTIDVFLVEAKETGYGTELSDEVARAVDRLEAEIVARISPGGGDVGQE